MNLGSLEPTYWAFSWTGRRKPDAAQMKFVLCVCLDIPTTCMLAITTVRFVRCWKYLIWKKEFKHNKWWNQTGQCRELQNKTNRSQRSATSQKNMGTFLLRRNGSGTGHANDDDDINLNILLNRKTTYNLYIYIYGHIIRRPSTFG
jgi:hypothetical protein